MPREFLQMLLYAMLPVAGNLIGSALAESVRAPNWLVGASLHAAAGIAIAVVSIDLMPRMLANMPLGMIVTMFLAGALASVLLASLVWTFQDRGRRSVNGSAWMVYAAVGADLVSDGLMTGAGTAIGSGLGLLLASSQSVANIPGGFAATANLRDKSVPRRPRLVASAAMIVPVFLSAAVGFWMLGGASSFVQHSALAFITGVLLLATVEDVLPEGDAPGPPRWISTAAFAGGFAGFALLSGGLKG